MAAKTFAERAKYVKMIEKANDDALENLAELRLATENHDSRKIMNNYNSLTRNIYSMIKNYQNLTNLNISLLYLETFEKIETKTGLEIERHCKELRFGKKPKIDFEGLVERLNYQENSHGYDAINRCYTLHDLIRCLHASTVNSLFSGVGIDEVPQEKSYGSSHFSIVSADNGKNADLLASMLALYENHVPKKGAELYKVVSLEDAVSAKVTLGCHFSSVEVILGEPKMDLTIKFANTKLEKYPNAGNRAEYVALIMQKLGLETKERAELILGKKTYETRAELNSDLEQCVRMLASTKDLDLEECKIKGRVQEAVDAFFKGIVNIYRYLEQ